MFIAVFPFAFVYILITGKHRQGLRQRLGFLDNLRTDEGDDSLRIWIHGASVGEIQVARALISQIHKQLPEAAVILSTGNPHGFAVATTQLPENVTCIFAPLDLVGIVNRALKAVRPTVYICLETELWPNMIRQAYHYGAKLLLLNGRLSEKSFRGYRQIRGFMQDMLCCFAKIAVIQGEDAKRFRALGANPSRMRILGNAKYDQALLQNEQKTKKHYGLTLGLHPGQSVFVAGSTHTGEEAMLCEVFRALQQRIPDLVWVVAPRHLRRLDEVGRMFSEKGMPFQLLSQVKEQGRTADVIVVDTMGELSAIYSIATFVFCGGSLVARGGHNVLEAAAWGTPVFYGPSMKDFLDAKRLLEAEHAGFCVKTPQELAERLLYFIDRPEEYAVARRNALKVAKRQHGSAEKQVALIKEVLNNVTH